MKVLTSAETRAIDKFVMKNYGIPPVMFIDQAGRAILDVLLKEYPEAQKILVICGKGNNGGDGLVLARRLKQIKKEPIVVLLEKREKMSALSRLNFDLEIEINKDENDDKINEELFYDKYAIFHSKMHKKIIIIFYVFKNEYIKEL